MKFGGTSVQDAEAIRRLCSIVDGESRPTLVVVSAIAGVTDHLVDLGRQAGTGNKGALAKQLEWLHRRHTELATQIVSGAARDDVIDVSVVVLYSTTRAGPLNR